MRKRRRRFFPIALNCYQHPRLNSHARAPGDEGLHKKLSIITSGPKSAVCSATFDPPGVLGRHNVLCIRTYRTLTRDREMERERESGHCLGREQLSESRLNSALRWMVRAACPNENSGGKQRNKRSLLIARLGDHWACGLPGRLHKLSIPGGCVAPCDRRADTASRRRR